MRAKTFAIGLVAILLAACAGSSPPAVATPGQEALVPIGESPVGVFAARGVQVYGCQEKPGDSNGAQWVFLAPQADLFDEHGKPAGKHYAGPRWEAADGSTIAGTVQASAVPPRADAIPWLLLKARSVGGEGRFATVTSVQRINTVGGGAPAGGCTSSVLGRTVAVPYTADYAMFSRAPVPAAVSSRYIEPSPFDVTAPRVRVSTPTQQRNCT